MNRRSFFNRLLGAAAIVALAPQLCFKSIPEAPTINPARSKLVPFWTQTICVERYYSKEYKEVLEKMMAETPNMKESFEFL